jgi:hypothetical protein
MRAAAKSTVVAQLCATLRTITESVTSTSELSEHSGVMVSLTRIGATRQRFEKAFAVQGVEPEQMARAFTTVRNARVVPVTGQHGLFAVAEPMGWLGTRTARNEHYAGMSATFRRLAELVHSHGGVLVPPALGTTRHAAVLGGDIHTLEVLSSVEQEVLCNLLRTHVPALIALFGRGITRAGAPRDRIGSRWLAGSRSHLATRFLASTAPEHLDRVKAELRRRDGVALLERMDVYPSAEPDGTLTVAVRCLDGAPTLAGIRTQALLLAAVGMQARRMVRDGRRVGNVPQRMLEDNRARAVAEGLRAQMAADEPRQRPGAAPKDQKTAKRRHNSEPAPRPARAVGRSLFHSIAVELRNLDADAAELAPALLPLELPALGVTHGTTETDLMTRWAGAGESELLSRCLLALTDAAPGGPLLQWLSADVPGRTSIVLGSWRTRIAEAQPPAAGRPGQQSRTALAGKRSQPDRRNRHGGNRSAGQRGGNQARGTDGSARGRGAQRRRDDRGSGG